MDDFTPYDESLFIFGFGLANLSKVFLDPSDHRPRYVVGVQSIDDTQLTIDPYNGTIGLPIFSTIQGYLTLIEAGTMKPRVKRLPLGRLNATLTQRETFNGGTGSPDGFPGVQPFRLRYGPAIDLAASFVEFPGAVGGPFGLELFIRNV